MSMEELQVGAGAPKEMTKINPTQLRPVLQGTQQGQQGPQCIPVDTALMIGEQAIQIRGLQQEMQRLGNVLKIVEDDRNRARKELEETKAKLADSVAQFNQYTREHEARCQILEQPPDPPAPKDEVEAHVDDVTMGTRSAKSSKA